MKNHLGNQKGITLAELTIVVAVASFALAAAAAYSIPMIENEKMRSAVYDVQTMTQLARGEAVARNHECRFVVNADTGTLEVWDGMGTDSVADDDLLYEKTLPNSVAIARPDGGTPVTLERMGTSELFQTSFNADGTVESGSGGLFLHGASSFQAVSIVDAGGTLTQKWDGGNWKSAYYDGHGTSSGGTAGGDQDPRGDLQPTEGSPTSE